jgi:oxalate---CoA ligase
MGPPIPPERTLHPVSLSALLSDPADARRWLEDARSHRVVTRGEAARLADAWRSADVPARVVLRTADPLRFAALFVALVAAGVVVVPLDAGAPDASLADLVRTSGAEAVVAPDGAGDLGLPTIAVDEDLHPRTRSSRPRTEGGVLLFSSGSTGPRKPILLPAPALLHVARAVATAHGLGPDDRAYNALPLFHVNAEVVAVLGTLVSGGTAVLDARFHRTGFWELIAQRRVTWVNAVPAVLAILADGPRPDVPLVRFVRSASAPLPVSVLERFEARTGLPVVETYGMTEAASQITANPVDGVRKPGSAGIAAGTEVAVLDAGDRPVVGETGRIVIRGPGVVTRYDDSSGTDSFRPGGWLDTGDLGHLDADGYLFLAGRTSEVVNRGGEKIFPREVEDVLLQHPAVREAVLVGRDDEVLGQVPVAYVVADDSPALRAELDALCRDRLPRSHRPVALDVLEELPTGPTGKVVRRLVTR